MPTNTPTYLTSPVGEIQFLALNNKVSKKMALPNSTYEGPKGYAARVKFDSNTKEGAKWRKEIEAINPNLIGIKHVSQPGEFTVRAFSLYKPEVRDGNNNPLEEAPNFYADSKGTARMVVTPYTGNSLGGTINLAAVMIYTLENKEQDQGDKLDRLAQLQAELDNAAKQGNK